MTPSHHADEPTSSPPPEAGWLAQYLAGDAAAFERLYDLHERHCFDFIRRTLAATGDDATAEDLHQDVWLAVARQAASFDQRKARFVTWLFTIARNKVHDHFRISARVSRLVGDGGELLAEAVLREVPDPAPIDPEQIAHNRQLAAALLREIQALPLSQRETFLLFAQAGLGLDEVATVTRVGIETAKSRLRYARQTLKARLMHWRGRP